MEWAPWTNCTLYCGPGGRQSRTRYCDDMGDGWLCEGNHTEKKVCDNIPCPRNGILIFVAMIKKYLNNLKIR
jgi:hypothetical protein